MNKLVYASIVRDYLRKKGQTVTVVENCKNNCCQVGLSIKSDTGVSPIFYIMDEEERTPQEFADYMLAFKSAEFDKDRLSEIMLNKEEILKRSHYILVNSKLNERKQGIVRVPVNDTLEMHYKIDISDVVKDGNIVVEYTHLSKNNINEEEFIKASYNNTRRKYPLDILNIGEALNIPGIAEPFMWILTNRKKIFGAGAILYKGARKKLLEKFDGKEFVLLPSSVHEWIAVPEELGSNLMGLSTIIRDVNRSVVDCEEVLSDRPYKLIGDGQLVEA